MVVVVVVVASGGGRRRQNDRMRRRWWKASGDISLTYITLLEAKRGQVQAVVEGSDRTGKVNGLHFKVTNGPGMSGRRKDYRQ